MTIHALEHDDPLDPEHVRKYPTAHPRCGTEFLVVVILLSILMFSLVGRQPPLVMIASRILLIPVIASVGYELLRLGRPAPVQPGRPRDHVARDPRPEDHDQAAHRRHDRGRDRGHGGGDPRRRRPRSRPGSLDLARDPMPLPGETAAGVRAAAELAEGLAADLPRRRAGRAPRSTPTASGPCPRTRRCPAEAGMTATMTDDHGLDGKLEDLARQYDDVSAAARHPGGPGATRRRCARLGRELSRLEPVVARLPGARSTSATQLAGARHMRDAETDEDLQGDGARGDRDARGARDGALDDLRVSLLPRDPNDDRNVIVEIRAGAGGEEAALFATELLRMYSRYAQEHRFADRPDEPQRDRHRRHQGGDPRGRRRRRLQPAQVRGRRPPRPARPVDGVERPHPHEHGDGHRPARGRRGRGRHRRGEGPPDRRQAQLRAGRPVGQHDRLRGPDHAPAHGAGRRDPGREEPAQEQGQGDGRAALPPVRPGAREAARGAERRAPG